MALAPGAYRRKETVPCESSLSQQSSASEWRDAKHRNKRQAPRPALSPGQWWEAQSARLSAALSEQPQPPPAGRLAQGTATCRTGVANSFMTVLAGHLSGAAPEAGLANQAHGTAESEPR